MTNSHSQNPPQPASSGSQYEGFDPELPEHDQATGKTAKVSTIQVGASAAAAVTSAVFASFFGVAGTLIGAAVGSIVSTVAGAFYADYMRRASKVVKTTTTVVVQRMPPDRLATSALRKLAEPGTAATTPLTVRAGGVTDPADPADPAAVPPTSTLRPVDAEAADETVVVPVEPGTELLAAVESGDETRVMPAVTGDGGGGTAEAEAQAPRSWWRRPVVGFALVGVASFAIAIGVITAAEGVIGHPISGGSGGTTLSKVSSDTSSKTSTSTPTATVTVTETTTATPSASATTEPSATATQAPAATTTTAPEATTSAPAATTAAPTATSEATQNSGEAAGALATTTP